MPEDNADKQLSRDFDLAHAVVREAGTLALAYFHGNPQIWTKGDDSPVSEADLAVDKLLRRRLGAARPDYGWISEEIEDNPARLDKAKVWVIDPIDGTRAFLGGTAEWVICLALVEAGTARIGLVYNPLTQELFSAVKGRGAHLNDQPIHVGNHRQIENAQIIAAAGRMRGKGWRADWPPLQLSYVNSLAYRIALVAAGRCDATVVFSRFHEWDVAAADLILTEAGGKFTDIAAGEFTYNRPSLRLANCLGANPHLHQKLADFIATNQTG
ncbi:MAG: 3'(2'),5'-bisphosphate nucleotidase CysQ [Alphaproteobacteria bacterium]